MNCYLHTYLSTPPAFNILGIHHLDAHVCIILEKAEEGFYFSTINSLAEAYPLSLFDLILS